MNEDLIKIKLRKMELKIAENEANNVEEIRKLFEFFYNKIHRLSLKIVDLEIKIEMNKSGSRREKIHTLNRFREHQKVAK